MKQSLPSLKLTYQSSKPSQLSLLLNSELPLLDRVANESANKRIGTVDSTTLVKRESFQIKKKNREGMESRQIARQKE